MVMRSLRHIIKPHKRPKFVNNPHKRNPDKYFRSIWVSKKLWEIIEMLAEVERKTPQAAAIYLLEGAARQYIEEGLQVENKTRELMKDKLIPYKKPSRFIRILRAYLAKHGEKNPRIDNGYKLI